MTDLTPSLREAIEALRANADPNGAPTWFTTHVAAELLAALPADLVAAATVEMPKEPGLYVGPGGTTGVVYQIASRDGDLFVARNGRKAKSSEGPFRRLVAEGDGPTHVFTGEELRRAYDKTAGAGGASWTSLAAFVNTYAEEAGR